MCLDFVAQNVGLIVGNKRLDDYATTHRTAADVLRDVNGGRPIPETEFDTHQPKVVPRLRDVNGGRPVPETAVPRPRSCNDATFRTFSMQMVRKVNGG